MNRNDPAYWMLFSEHTSTPTIYSPNCYICCDPEYAQMGLPLCYKCFICGAHVPADGGICDNKHIQPDCPESEIELKKMYSVQTIEYDVPVIIEHPPLTIE